ncbi:uncharacterized protein LOC121835717 [Ixodes scapularis]|uniref:uncharacterized protein LOC121835717 n=1 Tax=Ixodes scapularis TaxID=6945 RepID=UPI001C395C21|nr:uncharacterized protein LOC121835717 [Ixodes scapularis]
MDQSGCIAPKHHGRVKFRANQKAMNTSRKKRKRLLYNSQYLKIINCAWWGGFWERLVRSVKVSLRKVLGRSSLNFEELTTVLTEVEAVVNSRPVTFISTDAKEREALTPAHFLVGHKLTSLPSHQMPEEDQASPENLARGWKYRNTVMNQFWRRWRSEYLLELRSAHIAKPSNSSCIQTGDLVLLKDNRLPRHMWKLCRVNETFPGRDGKVRSCRIITPSGRELCQPIQLLYSLEL